MPTTASTASVRSRRRPERPGGSAPLTRRDVLHRGAPGGAGIAPSRPAFASAPGAGRPAPRPSGAQRPAVVFRQELGDVLREARRTQGRTLRQVSSDARVSLGYLSEIERGQKEASSELLAAVAEALGLPLSFVLREVSDRIALAEGVVIPDTVPDGLADARHGAEPHLVGAR